MAKPIVSVSDPSQIGILIQRMDTAEREVSGVRRDLNQLETTLNASITALGAKIEERSRIPLGLVISVLTFFVLIMGIIGGLAITPVIQDNVRNRELIANIAASMVPRSEIDQMIKYRDKSDADLNDRLKLERELLTVMITRNANDVTELKQQVNAVGIKDVLTDLQRRQDRLEQNQVERSVPSTTH